jgi:catechol 2,3-dioxygenase-like lactoylglutathione lyase family enzyme
MAIHVYGCNHVAVEVTDAKKAVKFYADVFGLKMFRGGEGAAWCKLGEHQFMAIFEVKKLQPDRVKHFGLMVRDDRQIKGIRSKLTKKYKLKLVPGFRCDFRDPWGNRIQVVDLHDESLVWLPPYREMQRAGIVFRNGTRKSRRREPSPTQGGEPWPT